MRKAPPLAVALSWALGADSQQGCHCAVWLSGPGSLQSRMAPELGRHQTSEGLRVRRLPREASCTGKGPGWCGRVALPPALGLLSLALAQWASDPVNAEVAPPGPLSRQ